MRGTNKRKNKGFTLAELLIVVAIIAVLVAVSIPIFTGKLEQARIATTEANIRAAKAAAMADFMGVAQNKKEKNWLKALSDFIVIKAKADSPSTFAEPSTETVGNYLYCYDANENSLKDTSIGSFVSYYGSKKPNNSLCTVILVEMNSSGIVATMPHIDSDGKVDKDSWGLDGDNSGTSGNNSGNETPVIQPKEYYTITVEKEEWKQGRGTVEVSTTQVEKGSNETVTITAVTTYGNFDYMWCDGSFDEISDTYSSDYKSETLVIRPNSDITVHVSFSTGSHSG